MALDRNRFKQVGSSMNVARMWPTKDHPLKEGDSIEGEYVEKYENIGPNKSNVYALDVQGERVGVWGSTVIDARMADVPLGVTIGFEYLGLEKGKGGKEYKNFMVAVESDLEVGEVSDDEPPI
jgi:hypothetical protein